jgi:hypothetical protein
MNIHKKARLPPIGRERLVEAMLGGQTPKAAVRPQASARRLRANGLTVSRWKGERA